MSEATARYVFFSGKGGVGKTSLSAATAVHTATAGKKTLIVTTDPASNLADLFDQELGHKITAVSGINNLWAMELDPDEATREYKSRMLAPLKEMLPATMLETISSQLDSPCTSEMAAFERFVDLLDEAEYDVIIFDTAPTGHTLRLLRLPGEWSRVIEEGVASGATTCIGPAQALADSKEKFDRALSTLNDAHLTKFIFTLRPDAASIEETERARRELIELGVTGCELIVNGVIPAAAATNAFFQRRRSGQLDHLRTIAAIDPMTKVMFLQPREISGVKDLHLAGRLLYDDPRLVVSVVSEPDASLLSAAEKGASERHNREPATIATVKLSVAPDTPRMVFFAGKGGVGKTLLSCICALNLADSGQRTLLVTTDPAAHLSQVLQVNVGATPAPISGVPGLWATRIDPETEAAAYRARVISEIKDGCSDERLAAIEEELDSPCTQEMAVFHAFVDTMAASDYDTIVFDTAPTGHTLRLLKLPVAWSKQLEIKAHGAQELSQTDAAAKSKFEAVIGRLQDHSRTSFIMVVHPEHTPIIEAHRSTRELEEIGITPAFVIANQVLQAVDCDNEFFAGHLQMQQHHLSSIRELFGTEAILMPLLDHEPRGIEALRAAPIVFEAPANG